MGIFLLRIRLLFLGRNLFCILVLLFELSLDIFLAYTCLVLVVTGRLGDGAVDSTADGISREKGYM